MKVRCRTMSKYGYEAFEDEQIEEILENIKDGFYEVFECKYGDYNLTILKENDNSKYNFLCRDVNSLYELLIQYGMEE